MKVKVAKGYQISHEDKVYTDGATLDVSAAEAEEWLAAGWATKVSAKKKAVSGSKNKAAQTSANKAKE